MLLRVYQLKAAAQGEDGLSKWGGIWGNQNTPDLKLGKKRLEQKLQGLSTLYGTISQFMALLKVEVEAIKAKYEVLKASPKAPTDLKAEASTDT